MNIDLTYQNLKNTTLEGSKFITAVPLSTLEGVPDDQVIKMLRSVDQGAINIMTEVNNNIDLEKERLLNEFTEFYHSGSFLSKLAKEGYTIEKIQNLIFEKNLRLQRLQLVYDLDFNSTESIKKSSGVKYDMVKINWIDDQGKRVRKISKTYGKSGNSGLKFSIPKFFEDHFEGYSNPILDYRINKSKVVADLKATLNGEDWVIEFVATKKSDFIENAVRLEMWKMYKETYGL
ncbi:hypothetical protein [Flavobacterium sp.]|uniref:hypothetical protein n=1 Tax=Flavobacterium sp. TaxID=239 RepID=UPI0025CD4152|nr:hypothetical protein [Flavobacterium sp.]